VLDIGTGTGLLALMIAQRAPGALVDAVEIDEEAAAQAAENVAASPWADRVRVHRMDVRRLHAGEPFDLVVCNPPYYPGDMEAPDVRVAVAKHSGGLGLGELVRAVAGLLADEGRFACIIPANREKELLLEAGAMGLGMLRRCMLQYLAGRPAKRVLLELGFQGEQAPPEELLVGTGPGVYSTDYMHLLKDFMLGF
jgi:tRNA1Val (adenine37-N6)-methyltransferase